MSEADLRLKFAVKGTIRGLVASLLTYASYAPPSSTRQRDWSQIFDLLLVHATRTQSLWNATLKDLYIKLFSTLPLAS